jgi:hypothetical protein
VHQFQLKNAVYRVRPKIVSKNFKNLLYSADAHAAEKIGFGVAAKRLSQKPEFRSARMAQERFAIAGRVAITRDARAQAVSHRAGTIDGPLFAQIAEG